MSGEKEMSEEQLRDAVAAIVADPSVGKLLSGLRGGDSGDEKSPPAVTEDMMRKLPQIMEALRPLVQGAKGSADGAQSAADAEKRKKLLSALRPYLNEKRRGAVDQILRVTEVTDLLGGLEAQKPKG